MKNKAIKFICKGKDIIDDSIKIEEFSNTIFLEGLPIADANNTNLPNLYFDEILKRLNYVSIPRETLSQILELNILIRKKILTQSELQDNEVSKMFSKIINYELNLISSCDSSYMNQ